jgi:hypothetical protein
MQMFIKHYKETTGKTEVDMRDVARLAIDKGWKIPKPVDAVDRLAREFSRAAREETRYDEKRKSSYRVNHAITDWRNGNQITLWVDIDEAPRDPMLKAFTLRREQMVGDGLQLTLDAEHWNGIHPKEQPIRIELDLAPDVEWRKNAPNEDQEVS